MTRSSKIKKKVLRAVYEDNAGIPRSCHGKRRTRAVEEAAPAPDHKPGYRVAKSMEIRLASWAEELIEINQTAAYDDRFIKIRICRDRNNFV